MGNGAERVPDPLAIRAAATPERTGLIDAGTGDRFTYRTLDDAASSAADWVESTTGGDPTVGLLLDRRPAVAPLVFGGLRAGARVALLDVELPPATLAARFDRLDGDVLVCEADTLDAARACNAAEVACVDPPDSSGVAQIDPFEGMRGVCTNRPDVDADRPDIDTNRTDSSPVDLGELVAFTSGTTGDPKAVRLELEGLVASAVASALRLGVAADDRWLVPIPTYHVGGLSPILRCTLSGTTAVLQCTFDATATIDAIEAHDVTCTSMVPTQLSRVLDAGWNPPERLRFVLLGGGPIPASLVDRCAERGVPVCPTYGTTETASQVATALPSEAFAHRDTVGRPLAFTDVTIVEDGVPCDSGDIGEVVVDGPTVTPGYPDDEHTAAAFGEYGFHTGDLGSIDADGRLRIEGRLDDRIVTGGEVVSASVVADVIESVDGVDAVAVVGIEDEEWGERVGALVATRSDLTSETVREQCRTRLPDYAVPKTVAFVDRLPYTPSGTVDRTLVRNSLD